MATVHVFADTGSFFSRKTIAVVERLRPGTCYYYFFNGSTENLNENQLTLSELEVKLANDEIHKLVFHSLHDYQLKWLKTIKKQVPSLQITWVFWSYEYYQLSFNLKNLYSKHTQKYYWRKRTSNALALWKAWRAGNLESPFAMTKKAYLEALSLVDDFYAFVPQDGVEVFGNSTTTKIHPFSYLPLSDVAVQFKAVKEREAIMVGHNGNPLVNHADALEDLANLKETAPVLIPLSYGKPAYITDLKKYVSKSALNVNFQETYMPLEDYYTMLSGIRAYIQPTRCQQGLGNIVFFLYSGASIYLCKESSTYKFLKSMNLTVFSMEDLQKGLIDLTSNQQEQNKAFVEEYINDARFEEQWENLIQ